MYAMVGTAYCVQYRVYSIVHIVYELINVSLYCACYTMPTYYIALCIWDPTNCLLDMLHYVHSTSHTTRNNCTHFTYCVIRLFFTYCTMHTEWWILDYAFPSILHCTCYTTQHCTIHNWFYMLLQCYTMMYLLFIPHYSEPCGSTLYILFYKT